MISSREIDELAALKQQAIKLEEEQGDIERLLSGGGVDDQIDIFGSDNAAT